MKQKILILLLLIVLITVISQLNMSGQNNIQIGDKIPVFSLKDQNGVNFDSSDYIGNTTMVIYFYPKDDTPGCTKEACKFRDSYEEFTDRNVKVIGISSDDMQSHKDFATKYNLPFTLLSDPDNEVRKLFGVKSNMFGMLPGRVTYVVNNKGIVQFIYDNMFSAEKHIDKALEALK